MQYNYKRRNLFSAGPHLLGLIFIATGIFTLISPYLMQSDASAEKVFIAGGSFILFGTMVIFSYSGTVIDFTNKRYREYYFFCGMKFGSWQTLPEVNKIKVLSEKFKATSMPNGINPAFSGEVTAYKALLYSPQSKPFLTFTFEGKEQAIKEGKILAGYLNAELEL